MDRQAFINAMRTIVTAHWSDTTANGIYLFAEIGTIPIEDISAASRFPFAIINDEVTHTGRWGLANKGSEGIVTLYRVTKDTDDFESDVLADLETMRDGIITSPTLDYGFVLEAPETYISATEMLNDYFLRVHAPMRSGAVRFRYAAVEA